MKVEVLWVVVKGCELALGVFLTSVTEVEFPLKAVLGTKTIASLASLGLSGQGNNCVGKFFLITL